MNRTLRFGRPIATAMFGAFAMTSVMAQTPTPPPATPKPAAAPEAKEADMFDGQWHFGITPYLWLPNINGSTEFPLPTGAGQSVSAEVGPNSYLSNLKFAAMVTGEARKGEWGMFTDYIYLHFAGEDSKIKTITGPLGHFTDPIYIGTSSSLTGNVWSFAGTYTPVHQPGGYLDLLGGFRLLSLDMSLDLGLAGNNYGLVKNLSVDKFETKWDAIIGAKGMVKFGQSKWFMPYYADIGAGSENWTWQAVIGVGYKFHWGSISLVERSLSYDFSKQDTNLRFTGPALAFSWTW